MALLVSMLAVGGLVGCAQAPSSPMVIEQARDVDDLRRQIAAADILLNYVRNGDSCESVGARRTETQRECFTTVIAGTRTQFCCESATCDYTCVAGEGGNQWSRGKCGALMGCKEAGASAGPGAATTQTQ